MNRILLKILSCILLLILSCGPIHEWPTTPGKISLGSGARIRFLNIALEISPVDIFIGNQKVQSYSTFSLATALLNIRPGSHEISIKLTGTSEILLKDTIKIDSGQIYTYYFENDKNRLVGKLTEIKQELISGKAKVRFANISDDLGTIDLNIFNSNDNYLITEFQSKSFSSFISLIPGTSKINVFWSGTQNLTFTTQANLDAGKIYTCYLIGQISGTDSTALNAYFIDELKEGAQKLFTFELGNTYLRFINGVTFSTSIQIFVDEKQIRASLPFNQATQFFSYRAGVRKVRVNAGSISAFIDSSFYFEEQKYHTVYLSNSNNKSNVFIIPNERKSVPGNRALVRFINASHDLENVLINFVTLTGPTTLEIQNLGGYTNYFEVLTGQNVIKVSSSGKPNLLNIAASFEGGRVYSAFISGSYMGNERDALLLSFVKDNDSLGQQLFNFPPVRTAIRLINGTPEFTGLDLILENNKVVSNLSFNYASKYSNLNTGFRNVKVMPTGSSVPIYESTINLEHNKKYILFAIGRAQNPDVLMLEHTVRNVPFGKVSLRFANGIFDQNNVDLKIINSSGTTTINQILYKSVTGFLDLPSGKNQFVLLQSGTSNVLTTCEAILDVGVTYTCFLTGISSGTSSTMYSLGFLKEIDDTYHKLNQFNPIKTNVRFINGISDNPRVDFYVENDRVASNISYKLATALTKVNSGSNLSLRVTRLESITQIYSRVVNINYDKEYTFIVCGQLNFPDGFLIENPTKLAPSGRSSIRVIHALPGLGNLSLSVTNSSGTFSIPNIPFRSASNYLDLISGNNKITITIASVGGNIVLTSDSYLEEGKVYSLYVLGNPAASGEQQVNIFFLNETNPGAQELFKFNPIRTNLRFVNGSTDNPLLELNVDENIVASNVTYKLATSILQVNSGVNRRIKVFEFGSSTPLITTDLSLNHAKAYTFLVTNKKNQLEYIFFENPTKQALSGRSSIRFVHGAFDLETVDIVINNYTSITRLTNITYKNVTSYYDVPSGFNEIIVTRSGSASSLIIAIDATLEEGKVYTVYLLGNNSGNFGEEYSLNFLDETNPAGQYLFSYTRSNIASLRVINASPNSTGLDVTLDQTKIAQNVWFGNSSGYLFTRSGIREVKVTRGGTSSPILLSFNFNFETNNFYTLVLTDSISKLTPLLVEDLKYNQIAGKAFVRFINASPNSIPLDIKIGNPAGTIKHSYFTYQQITSYEPYDPAIISFVFTRTNTNEELISLRGLSLLTNKAYTIVVMGFFNGPPGQNLQVKWFLDN